jgi:hypothetical protein
MIQKNNSVQSAGTKDDSNNVADVTTSAQIDGNTMLAVRAIVKRNKF